MKRTRRTRITMHGCEVNAAWSNPTLKFTDFRNGECIEVIITIDSPWAIRNLREGLSKIVKNWKDAVADL